MTASTRPPLEIRRTQLSKLMSPHNHRTDRPRYKDASSSGRAVIPTVESQGLSVLQLNAEGRTNAKLDVIRQLADSNQVHGSPPYSNIEWLVTEVQETTLVTMYKPPPSELYTTSLPSVPAPAIYAGDFNCQHIDWGYKQTTKDGETLSEWASSAEAVLLYDPREPPIFISARWNTYTNPDLAFAVCRSCDPKPERRIIDRFLRSHHRPSIIKVPSLVQPIACKPVKRWNFRKANWELSIAGTGRRTPVLPNPQADDVYATYTAYCNMLICAAKKNIPRDFNKHYIPGWDDSCNHLLREHQQATTKEDIVTTATALHHKLDEVRRARWTEVVESVDFTHSSRKAWQTINKLTGRSTTHSRCPVNAKCYCFATSE